MSGGRTALAAAAFFLVLPAAAAAHPRLVSDPPFADRVLARGPAAIELHFDEKVRPVGDGIRVTGPAGQDVSSGPTQRSGSTLRRPLDATSRGTYLVRWLVVGGDTHPARGAFLFSVGEPTGSGLPDESGAGLWLESLGRLLSFAGLVLGFGVPFAAALAGGMSRRLWRLVTAGVALMIASEPLALLGQTASLAPSGAFDRSLAGDVLLTSYGHVAGLRLGAALALWALAGAVRQSAPRMLWSIPALGVAASVAVALASHRIAGVPGWLGVGIVATHVAAMAAWLGCVVTALAVRRTPPRRAVALAVLALALTGAGLALTHLASLSDLTETTYGAALSVKLAFVAVALALGVWARRRYELALLLGVLGAAAVLASLLPPV